MCVCVCVFVCVCVCVCVCSRNRLNPVSSPRKPHPLPFAIPLFFFGGFCNIPRWHPLSMKLLLCLCERNVMKERVREIKNNDINQHKQSFSSCFCSRFLRDHFVVNSATANHTVWLGRTLQRWRTGSVNFPLAAVIVLNVIIRDQVMRLLIVTSVAAFLQPLFILRPFEHQSIFVLNFLYLSFAASVKKCVIVDVRPASFCHNHRHC